MEVKGVAFLARQLTVVESHGEPAWQGFLAEYARKDPVFARPVMPVTRLPVEAFLRFNEALVERFYGGEEKVYWDFGVKSAEYALGKGQLKTVFAPGEFRRFLQFTPGIWKGYFTAGELQMRAEGDAMELRLLNVPLPHIYFELSVMGFGWGGLRMLGASNLRYEAVKGFSKGHSEVLYRFNAS